MNFRRIFNDLCLNFLLITLNFICDAIEVIISSLVFDYILALLNFLMIK
jgi:hypothetical protein